MAACSLIVATYLVPDCLGESSIATWKNNAKAAYSFTTDDNRSTQVYTIAPALTERGLRGTFYVNASPNRGNWTNFLHVGDINGDGRLDGYAHLPEQGHELGSHTSDHWAITVGNPRPEAPDQVFASYEDLAADSIAVNEYIEGLTGQRVVSFAYPWGKSDPPSREVIGQHYLSGRSILGSGPSRQGQYIPNPATPAEMHRLHVFNTEGEHSWADYRIYSEAIASYNDIMSDTLDAGGWAIEFIHQTGNGNTSEYGYYGNWGSTNRQAYYEHLDNIAEKAHGGDLWQDTVGNITRYIYSRDAATIVYDEVTDSAIKLRVDDLLDDDLYSVPLTIFTPLPETWLYGAQVVHDGLTIDHSICTDPESGVQYINYNVVADGKLIELIPGSFAPSNADYNSDGFITEEDFDRWREDFGTAADPPGSGADVNFDGVVNATDYTVWRDQFNCLQCRINGRSGGGFVAAALPEPVTMFYLLPIAAVALYCRRRSRNPRSSRS